MDMLYKHIGENVRAARKKANVTQAKLAEALGISTSHFSGLECGKKKFNFAQVVAIARYLKVPLNALLAGLIDEEAQAEASMDEIEYFPAKHAAQDFARLIRNCSQEEINAILEVCRIMVEQMSKTML